MEIQSIAFEDLTVGQTAQKQFRVSAENVLEFARISGDNNPVHLDPAYAARTPFGQVIAPGLLVSSHISALIAMRLPGPGSIYVQQNLKFRAPVFLDEELTAAVVIQELKSEGRRVVLSTSVTKADGEAAISGFAIVKAPRESSVVEVEPLDA
mgnify:CR=1 FL=1